MRRHRVAVTALARMPAYVAGAVCAAGMAACSNVMASGAAPTGASESRQAPNPLADRLTGMGPIERDVYRRVYEGRTGIEQAVRLQKMSYEELVAKTDFARWEIDPAEFARNLETKRRELAAMKARHDRRMRRLAQEKSLLERAEESRAQIVSGRKSWTSFWKHEQYLALFQTCFLHPDKSGDYRWVAGFLADLLDPLSQALQEELKKPGFPASPFGKARSAADMFLIAEAYERAHPDFAARERAAHAQLQTVMGLLKAVAYEAWTFHVPGHDNGGMRRKKPMQTATFRYCGGFTSGNFGYRPLIECAMVHHDTRMMDIIKDVIEKSLSSRCGYHNQGDCFWMDGIKSEHTLFAHGDQNYILGYGQDYVREVVALGERLRGGCWKVEPRKWAGLADVFLDGYQWYVHQGAQEITIMGRHSLYAPETAKKPSGPRWSSEPWGKRLFFDGFRLHKRTVALAEGQLERQAEFDAMAERMKANEDLIGNRYFWNSEDLLHHRKLQYVCVNMSSVRVKGPEGATFPDHATLHNRLFGCGMTVLKRKGGDLDRIRGAWDYAALPGITFARGDSFRYSRSWESAYGKNIYSGGVSDGANGLCAFKYRQKGISLAVNKAYFAFDDRLVCLGSALVNPEGKEAWTTVNQCEAKTEVRLLANGVERTFPRGEPVAVRERSAKPIAVWHDQMGYIVFPHEGKAVFLLSVENRMTQWREISNGNKDVEEYPLDMFRLSVLHDPGRDAPNQGYRYAVLFNVSSDELVRRLASGEIAILQNDARVQAVRCGGYTGVVFLEEGAFRSERLELAVDRPAVLMLDEADPGSVKLTYGDPLLDPAGKELLVKTNLRLAGPAAQGGVLHLPLPRIPEVGKPATARFALRTEQ